MKRYDVMVLGAGMVGIATALHLLARGRSVVLVDRRGPAEETSYGNAGLIQSEAVMPYAFPRSLTTVLGVLSGRRADARIDWRALPRVAPWLVAYAANSAPQRVLATARANAPIIARALPEHKALMEAAGVLHLLRPGGYLKVYRTDAEQAAAQEADTAVRDRFGIEFAVWDRARLAREEPHLSQSLAGAIHLTSPASVEDPGDLGAAYARLFTDRGGVLLKGDAAGLEWRQDGFALAAGEGPVAAREAVVALGPWSGDLIARFGVRLPLAVKRGYHMHYGARGNAVLKRLVVDEANGFVITPNKRGIRLTTGAEFALRDAPASPRQLERVEPIARHLFPLAERLDEAPWKGARPCFPDLLPAVGPVPGVAGLWGNFGHHHLGLTLGPATGRLLAEIMTGAEPFADPAPYALTRFGR